MGQDGFQKEARRVGAVGFLVKPFMEENLVKSALKMGRRMGGHARQVRLGEKCMIPIVVIF